METTREIELESSGRVKRIAEAISNLFKKSRYEPATESAWANDRLGYWPPRGFGGAMSEYSGPGDRGMLGVLARIEMNEEDGRPLDDGLPQSALRPNS